MQANADQQENIFVPWIAGSFLLILGLFTVMFNESYLFDKDRLRWTHRMSTFLLHREFSGPLSDLTHVVVLASESRSERLTHHIIVKGKKGIDFWVEIANDSTEAKRSAKIISDLLEIPVKYKSD